MRLRRILIGAIAAASVIVAAGVVVSFLPTRSGHSVAQTVFDGGSSTTTAQPSPSEGPRLSGASGAKSPGGSKTAEQDDSLLTAVGTSSETIPTATPTPYRLHPTAAPKTVTASDLAAAPHSKVASKSVNSAQGTTQIFLSATTSTKPADTVAYYQGVFTSLGMTGKPVPAVGGSTAIAFTRGASTVTLTVSAHDKGSSYLIHGVLRTGA